jgi:hypothetical protein
MQKVSTYHQKYNTLLYYFSSLVCATPHPTGAKRKYEK